MIERKELISRLALKRRRKLGSLSDEAFAELELAVQRDPSSFVDDSEEEALWHVATAIDRYHQSRSNDDLLDDEQYAQERTRRFALLSRAAEEALSMDEDCVDALLLRAITRPEAFDAQLDELLSAEKDVREREGEIPRNAAGDAWADVFCRPRLRLENYIAHTCLITARYRMAVDRSCDLLTKAPLDMLGARFTCALAMARLEDEQGFDWLDARDGRHGNAWMHLGRAILMYKLGRMPAARRALRGYDNLCTGGAYAMLQPVFVDVYVTSRPKFTPGTFEETMLAVHEADPVICDVPDFAAWACDQPGFLASAQDYCQRNGFEWRDWS